MVMITLYVRQQKSHRCKEQTLESVGEGEGGMICENDIETYILSCNKRIASLGSIQDTGCLGLVHWDTQRDGMGRVVGGGFRVGNSCTPVVDSCQCMAKPIQYCKVKKNTLTFFLIATF